jgi:hypothetical protein
MAREPRPARASSAAAGEEGRREKGRRGGAGAHLRRAAWSREWGRRSERWEGEEKKEKKILMCGSHNLVVDIEGDMEYE